MLAPQTKLQRHIVVETFLQIWTPHLGCIGMVLPTGDQQAGGAAAIGHLGFGCLQVLVQNEAFASWAGAFSPWLQLTNGLAELLPPGVSASDALRIVDTYVKV